MLLKIVSGSHRGRRVSVPKGAEFRPTSHKVRKAVFDIASARIDLTLCRFLDYCAGSGAVGLEALSRGTRHAEFVEKNRKLADSIEANLLAFDFTARSRVVNGARPVSPPFELIFADPPYGSPFDLDLVSTWLAPAGLLFYQTDEPEPPGSKDFAPSKSYRYGTTFLHLYTRNGDLQD